jgi:uncharacterized membrane protein
MRLKKCFSSEDGSVLLFGIGLSIAGLMIATVSINVASIWITRNTLDGIADGAALSAAQAIDTDDIYQNGLDGSLRLNERIARSRVREYVNAAGARSKVEQFAIRSVVVTGKSVMVTVEAKPRPAFGYLMPISAPVVVSAAKAINKVR